MILDINPEMEKKHNVVLYGDGSADNNLGIYGVGITGYMYTDDTINTTSSDKPNKYAITDIGYLETELLAKYSYKTVVPSYYIDGMLGYEDKGTNNIAELKAFLEPLRYLFQNNINNYNVKSILFKSDSSYTLLVIDYLVNQPDVTWRKKLTINLDLIEEILYYINLLKENQIELKWSKVIGHSTSLGNNLADRLALHGRLGNESSIFIIPAKKHWSKTFDIHPLLRFRQSFFMTNDNQEEPMYIIMDYKSNEEVGKKTHDALFGITILKEDEPMIKDAMDMYGSKFGTLSVLSLVDLKVLSTRNNLYYYSLFGKNIYRYQINNKTIQSIDDQCVCKNVYPPGLAMQAYEKMMVLYTILQEYRNNKPGPNRIFTDVTHLLYEDKKKGDKKVCIIPNGENTLQIPLELYNNKIDIFVILGADAPSRNQLKAIENSISKVVLSTIKVEKTIEYQIILETKEGEFGIYTNLYSCRVFLKK